MPSPQTERSPSAFGNKLCGRAGSQRDIVARPEAVRDRRQFPPDSESRTTGRYRRADPESRLLDRDTRRRFGSHRTCKTGAVSLPASHRERFLRRRRMYTRPGHRLACPLNIHRRSHGHQLASQVARRPAVRARCNRLVQAASRKVWPEADPAVNCSKSITNAGLNPGERPSLA